MDRVGHAEVSVGVSAGALEADLVPVGAGAAVIDVVAVSVDGHEAVDPGGVVLEEELLHSVEVAEALLADVSADDEVALELEAGALDGPHDAEDLREGSGVVADARAVVDAVLLSDRERGVEREHGIDVGGHVDGRAVSGALDGGVDVVHGVPVHLKAGLLHHLLVAESLLLLVSGEGGDQHELLLFLPGAVFLSLEDLAGLLELRDFLQFLKSVFHG